MTAGTATPTTPVEWEEYVNGFATPEQFTAALKDGSFTKAVNAYKNSNNATMDALKSEVTQQLQASVIEMFKNGGGGDPKVTNKLDLTGQHRNRLGSTLYNKSAPGAKADGCFDSLAQFVQDSLADPRYSNEERVARFKNYSSTVPSEGGFLVPEEFRSQIQEVAIPLTVVRSRALVVPMKSAKLSFPAEDGDMVFYWVEEGQTIPESSEQFGNIELILHKLAGLASVPNELLHDAPALDAWLRNRVPKKIAFKEDTAYLKGDGIGKPLGQLHIDNPSLIVVPKEVGQPNDTITWNNCLAMFSRLLPESISSAVWIITPDAFQEVYTMALPVGTGGSAVMMVDGGGPAGPAMTLLGRPIIWAQNAPGVLGDQGDISLTDLSTYIIGDGLEMRLDTSAHSSFRSDKTDFRFVERTDGTPGLLQPVTPENNGPTLSATIQLESR